MSFQHPGRRFKGWGLFGLRVKEVPAAVVAPVLIGHRVLSGTWQSSIAPYMFLNALNEEDLESWRSTAELLPLKGADIES